MESNDGMKEVYFDQYCEKCKNHDLEEDKEPCSECLSEPVNQYSHKPVKWEEAERKKSVPKPDPEVTR